MGRADFAWRRRAVNFPRIHNVCIYICIFAAHIRVFYIYTRVFVSSFLGLFSTERRSRASTMRTNGRALSVSGSSVTPFGASFSGLSRRWARVNLRLSLSFSLSVYFVALLAASSSVFVLLCAARCLSRDEYGRPNRSRSLRITSSRSFHAVRALLRSRFRPRARSLHRGSPCSCVRSCPPFPSHCRRRKGPKISRGRTRLRHRPPYELRAYVNQYICKLFFLCFFRGATRIFYYFFFIFILAYFSVDYRTYTTRSIV